MLQNQRLDSKQKQHLSSTNNFKQSPKSYHYNQKPKQKHDKNMLI